MSEWQQTTLGRVLSSGGGKIQTGPFGSQLHASDYVESGIPCIMPTNMHNNRVNVSGIAFIGDKDAQRLSHHLVQEGDIVYSRRGDVTQKALIGKTEVGYFCGTGCLLVRPGDAIDPEFLTYHLSTPTNQDWIVKQAVGATMPNLNTAILSAVPLNLPPHKETQKKIAVVLSALDAKINCNNRINAELETMTKMLYDYWFVQFDFPDANGKPYKSSGGKMVHNATLKREIPAGWETIRLNELLQNRTDSIAASKVDSESPYTPIDVLPMKKMSFGVGQSSCEANSSLIRYKANDILIGAMRVYFHRVCVAPFDGITRTTVIVLRPNEPNHLPFLYQVCNEDRTINIASKISVGTQQPYVNWENALENHTIPYPEKDALVQKYSSMMLSITKDVINREKENAELAQLRDWLLPLLMNGQVTVA